ncbi:MAG: hypothetical protein GF329_10405 [Candidatus Lokiarchaeota archaeon]|nr:hypothetical protein [Candidatus Lokiarchaeota archaeon]
MNKLIVCLIIQKYLRYKIEYKRMLYCKKCEKEVVVMGVPYSAMSEDELNDIKTKTGQENKLILFNPPPIIPYHCPDCGAELEEK